MRGGPHFYNFIPNPKDPTITIHGCAYVPIKFEIGYLPWALDREIELSALGSELLFICFSTDCHSRRFTKR